MVLKDFKGTWASNQVNSLRFFGHEKVSLNVERWIKMVSIAFFLNWDMIQSYHFIFHIICFAGVCFIVYVWHVAYSAYFDAGSLTERWQVILHCWSQPFLEAHFGIVRGSNWLSRVVWLDRDEAENNQTNRDAFVGSVFFQFVFKHFLNSCGILCLPFE